MLWMESWTDLAKGLLVTGEFSCLFMVCSGLPVWKILAFLGNNYVLEAGATVQVPAVKVWALGAAQSATCSDLFGSRLATVGMTDMPRVWFLHMSAS